jgi:hypothetical protein
MCDVKSSKGGSGSDEGLESNGDDIDDRPWRAVTNDAGELMLIVSEDLDAMIDEDEG